MNATKSSRQSINTPKSRVMNVMDPFITGPSFAVTNITATSPNIIACPAMMFAKSLTMSENGFDINPNSSIVCIIGSGNFRNSGTSGHRISFQ